MHHQAVPSVAGGTMVPEPGCRVKTCDVTEDLYRSRKQDGSDIPSPASTRPAAKMRFLVSLFVVLSVAAFHSALSASLESAEKEEEVTNHDGLTWADDQLQEKDVEFEAAQKDKAAQKNVTEDQNEDSHVSGEDGSVEQHDDDDDDDDGESKAEGAAYSDGAAQESDSNSSEETCEHLDTETESCLDFSEQSTQNQDA